MKKYKLILLTLATIIIAVSPNFGVMIFNNLETAETLAPSMNLYHNGESPVTYFVFDDFWTLQKVVVQ